MSEHQIDIKKDIFDGLQIANVKWNGEISEVDFLSRLYDLTTLPSNDGRYSNMNADIWQHVVNNDDWDYWWIVNDERLDLGDIEKLKRFLEELVHPLVHPNPEEVTTIVEHVNGIFGYYGLQERLIPIKQLMGRTVFMFQRDEGQAVEMEKESLVAGSFSLDQIIKGKDKLKSGDNIGAMSNARSFLEGVFGDIHERITGRAMPNSGDLTKDFKTIQRLLKLSPEQHSNNAIKGIIAGLTAVLQNLDTASNKMSERHRPVMKAERHHAKLCLDAAVGVADFLYGSLEYQLGASVSLFDTLIKLLDSDIRLVPYEEIIKHVDVLKFMDRMDTYTSHIVLERMLDEFVIPPFNGYRNNDIFFAALNVLLKSIRQPDLQKVIEKCRGNNQAVGLPLFLNTVQKERVDLVLNEEMLGYLNRQST